MRLQPEGQLTRPPQAGAGGGVAPADEKKKDDKDKPALSGTWTRESNGLTSARARTQRGRRACGCSHAGAPQPATSTGRSSPASTRSPSCSGTAAPSTSTDAVPAR